MNRTIAERVADAVMYEGYILYPYRPSIKNRRRWTFGGLFPEPYSRAAGDASANRTECLIQGTPATSFNARVRFLHLTARRVGAGTGPPFRPVESLRVGGRLVQSWQEAEEREVSLGATLGELLSGPRERAFAFPGGRRSESIRDESGAVVGVLIREQEPVAGIIAIEASEAAAGLFRVTLRVACRTPMERAEAVSRDDAALRALVSTHAILTARGGAFVSLLDPPECWREAAASCRNVGTWPVLVGEPGQSDTMLSAPIILYDYPKIAPESPGDFFDGTEIDEMLTLRIMTLTDAEKAEMAALDDRAGALLARTEAMARAPFLGLHGTIRDVRGGGA